ncbi:MAG: hypothetical protein D3926_18815 [Desulfobacteraceae bacterium]|nr:MAG: hypothetical protein D3926_18815 [Desulfobacteraceae bacterium]
MKARFIIPVAILILILFCPGLSAREIKLVYVNFPPYEDRVDGKPKGILVQIVETAFNRAGIPFSMTYLPFQRGYSMVKEGRYDGLFNFYKIDKRLPHFDYSTPIIENPLVFFIRKDSQMTFQALDDLTEKKIGIMIGYTYGSDFDQAGHFYKEEASAHEHHFRKLLFGRIDAYPCDKMVGIYTARKEGLIGEFKILPHPLKIMNGHIGFTKGKHMDVIGKINREIEQMKQNREIHLIIDDYIMNNKI